MNTDLLVFTEIGSYDAYLHYREQNTEELKKRIIRDIYRIQAKVTFGFHFYLFNT